MAGKGKKSSGAKKAGRRHRKGKRTFNVYIHRVLQQVQKGTKISGKATKIVNSFVSDIFDRIATEAGSVARQTRRKTVSAR